MFAHCNTAINFTLVCHKWLRSGEKWKCQEGLEKVWFEIRTNITFSPGVCSSALTCLVDKWVWKRELFLIFWISFQAIIQLASYADFLIGHHAISCITSHKSVKDTIINHFFLVYKLSLTLEGSLDCSLKTSSTLFWWQYTHKLCNIFAKFQMF